MAWQRTFTNISAWIRRRLRQRGVRRFLTRLSACACVLLLVYIVLPWIGYQIIAPQGWHNSTVHGHVAGLEYAVSHDDPGLILACGHSLEFALPSLVTSFPHCWRTRDGGSQWATIPSPPFPDHSFHLIVPRADSGTFFAVGHSLSFRQPPLPQPVLVTHDVGTTWRVVTQLPGDTERENNFENALATGVYRDGKLYVLLVPTSHDEGITPQDFAFSADDGKTWTRAERAPSGLETAGWMVTSFAADYRSPHNWYRSLENKDGGMMLEHSSDDGQSWGAAQEVTGLRISPSHIVGMTSLATTPARPEALCASGFGTWLAASSDGGHTWRGGPSQIDFSNAHGYSPSGVQIGNDGSCYRVFVYQNTPGGIMYTSSNEGGPWYDVILRLDPHAQRSAAVPLTDDFSLDPAPVGGTDAPSWWYVPAGHGHSARIVIDADQNGTSLASLLETMQETNRNMHLWRPVP
jgi:hypothetical protein